MLEFIEKTEFPTRGPNIDELHHVNCKLQWAMGLLRIHVAYRDSNAVYKYDKPLCRSCESDCKSANSHILLKPFAKRM